MARPVVACLAAVLALYAVGVVAAEGGMAVGSMAMPPSNSMAVMNTTSPYPCVNDPTMAECERFVYTEADAISDLTSLCSDMSFMTACTLWTSCKGRNLTTTGNCDPFGLVASTCGPDMMSKMRGCKSYNAMCADGSLVPQCYQSGPLPFMPTTWNTTDTVAAMCAADAMLANNTGCIACSSRISCPDPLASMSVLCTAWPEMDACDSFSALCNEAGDDFADLCAGDVEPAGDIDPYGCMDDPTKAACGSWKYPHANVIADLDALCTETPVLVGCTLYNICKAAGTLDMNSQLCRPFILLGDICSADRPDLPGCNSYNAICAEGSVVPACSSMPPMENVLTTEAAVDDVLAMCGSHIMDGCELCTSVDSCQDPLAVLSKICWGMAGMADCKAFFTMCTWDPQVAVNFAALCTNPSQSVTDEST